MPKPKPMPKPKAKSKAGTKQAYSFSKFARYGLAAVVTIGIITLGTVQSNAPTSAHFAAGNVQFDIAKTSPLPPQQTGTRAYIGMNGNFRDVKISRIETPGTTPLIDATGNFSGMKIEDVKQAK